MPKTKATKDESEVPPPRSTPQVPTASPEDPPCPSYFSSVVCIRPTPPIVHPKTICSGQAIYADASRSLVVLGSVLSDGEAISDGNLHIYGTLSGRAMAGLSDIEEYGKSSARIYANKFEAELVAIGGIFATREEVAILDAEEDEKWKILSMGKLDRLEDQDTGSRVMFLDEQGKLKIERV
eukprot:CAMPEP_0194327932 /NCGR_PEP_ID=MMETSP0171-20130528/43011_1 /TAXON_ID=218684 /ORGANISM="Corethron pennatum, Strain L29A3" /LENGTH=180 /DNA_ID=CAMNT_0039088053 /DNA_START=172 /DNA_END=714 /DNA_ORIENTATION=+